MVHPLQNKLHGGDRRVSNNDMIDWGLKDLILFPCHFGPAGWPYKQEAKREYDAHQEDYVTVYKEPSQDQKRSRARENGEFHRRLYDEANSELRGWIRTCKDRPMDFSFATVRKVRCHPPQHA